MNQKVGDVFTDKEFADLLGSAEDGATTGWEMNFTSDLRDKWDQYGLDMFISEKQIEHLEKIANK